VQTKESSGVDMMLDFFMTGNEILISITLAAIPEIVQLTFDGR
jgi:hypothetical protein